MGESLLSVGLDVGTTTTQLIVSRLQIENRATGFAVPELAITGREILYRSPIHFTPLIQGELVDADAIRALVQQDYTAAGITREQVDTGAIIITGETSRKENAAAVLAALSDYAGEFVVATAGPDLESTLSARGAGAVDYARQTGKPVVHMDIGGGTSNLSLLVDGQIAATTCLNVGGRLLQFDREGTVTYVSPVLRGLTTLRVGDRASQEAVQAVARQLTRALEMAVCRVPAGALLQQLHTADSGPLFTGVPADAVISFSGGVADCIRSGHPWLEFGDMGPVLGEEISKSALCRGEYRLGAETIRATVIGAGCHSAQLSGSTVFHTGVQFPLKNLPVVRLENWEKEALRRTLAAHEGPCVLAFPGPDSPGYGEIAALAQQLAEALPPGAVYLAVEADIAKALGQALALRLPKTEILSIDRVRLPEGSYLDVGVPVGPALPVVVKTVILSRNESD